MHLSESLILDILNCHHFSRKRGFGKIIIWIGLIQKKDWTDYIEL